VWAAWAAWVAWAVCAVWAAWAAWVAWAARAVWAAHPWPRVCGLGWPRAAPQAPDSSRLPRGARGCDGSARSPCPSAPLGLHPAPLGSRPWLLSGPGQGYPLEPVLELSWVSAWVSRAAGWPPPFLLGGGGGGGEGSSQPVTLPDAFSWYPASPKGPLLDFFPVPSQRCALGQLPLCPGRGWLSGGSPRAPHPGSAVPCSVPRPSAWQLLRGHAGPRQPSPLCWAPGVSTRVCTRARWAAGRPAGAPPFLGHMLATIYIVRGAARGDAVLLPASARGVPGASGAGARPRAPRGTGALVLPSLPPVYSSASPGRFLPLCPHALPVPALHEEMSGKCLKSSSEPSGFFAGAARAPVPGCDPPRCRRGASLRQHEASRALPLPSCAPCAGNGAVSCCRCPFPV